MTDRTQFEQMLEALINEDKSTAQEIFHNIVVAKSREIYEELLENDFGQASSDSSTPPTDSGMEEEEEKDDSEDDFSTDDDTDDMVSDVDADSEEGDEPEGDVEDRVQDLEDALEDLKAEFEQLMAGEEGGEMPADDMGGDEFGADAMGADEFGADDSIEDESQSGESSDGTEVHHYIHTDEQSFMEDDEQLIREYVEKVGGSTYNTFGSMGDNGTNTKSPVAGKNDMGGTTANIAQSHVEVSADIGAKSTVQGNGVMSTKVAPNPDAKGNINVPGGKAGNAFTTKQPGHGAEKAGTKETATNKQSILRQAKK